MNTQRLAMQRDAVGLSLDIAGLSDLRRQQFRKVLPIRGETSSSSFIELMDAQPPQERMLIDHDRSVFEVAIANGDYEAREFSDGPRSLRVWTVDKGPIERFTGVDLIILNEDYNSLLLVQYKCMNQESAKGGAQWRYRPDDSFWTELGRMQEVHRRIDQSNIPPEGMQHIRLLADALYFKFCKRLPLTHQDGELADGMLMSLRNTDTFLKSDISHGPQEGRFIGYENCERYLNNSLFAALARDGWIGSRGLTDDDYKDIIGVSQSDRSLVFAQTRTAVPAGQSVTGRRRGNRRR